MINSFVKKLLIDSSLDRKSSWAIVRDGTVAEFSITNADEPKQYFGKSMHHQFLKKMEGNYIIDDSECIREIKKFSPVRLFRTKYASIMIKQKIPLQTEEIDGPHTHLLPQIILHKVHFPIPVNDDLCIQIQVDPFGSTIDGNRNYLPV